MKKIFLFLLLLPVLAIGQTTSTTLTTQVDNTIRGKTYTPTAAADMYQAILNASPTGTASGTNTYSVSLNGSKFTNYSQLNYAVITFTNANTSGTCSLNIDAVGALSIKGNDGNNLAVGAIKAGGTYILKYNGTNLLVINDGGGFTLTDGNGTTANSNAVDLGGANTANTTFTGNFNWTWASSGLRMGNYRVWSGGTIGLDASTSSFMQVGSNTISIDASQGQINFGGSRVRAKADSLMFHTNNRYRLKIDTDGSWDMGGTAPGTSGQVLTSNGSGSDPSWQSVPAGFTNPMTTAGDIIYGGVGGTATRLATGTGFLKAGTTPSWSSVSLMADVSGTLPVANGGTGVTSSTGTGSTVLSASPTFTGTPAAPTASAGTNTTQIATTAFVAGALSTPLSNPQTGNYTLQASDVGKEIPITSASLVTITLPASVFADGNYIGPFYQTSTGGFTFTTSGGATVTYESTSATTTEALRPVSVKYVTGNAYYVFNGLPPGAGGALTRTNDTNVTVTLSGDASDGLRTGKNITMTLGWTGSLAVTRGGTGLTGSANGDVVIGTGTNTIGVVNALATSRTANWHLKAGTATANTAPLKFTSGTLLTTIEAGAREFNGAHYSTSTALNRVGAGGAIADFITDVANSGTSETDIQTYTTKASTLSANGEKLVFDFTMNLSDITATAQIKVLFGGTSIGDTGALTVSATGAVAIRGWIIRTGSTTARSSVTISSPTASTALYTNETDLTGLTFTNTNILKTTATAGGAGGGTGDITGKLGTIFWYPAAAN